MAYDLPVAVLVGLVLGAYYWTSGAPTADLRTLARSVLFWIAMVCAGAVVIGILNHT
jgi:hypothetical protein